VTGHYDTRETNIMETHSFAPAPMTIPAGTAVSMEAARVLSSTDFGDSGVCVRCRRGAGLNGTGILRNSRRAKAGSWKAC